MEFMLVLFGFITLIAAMGLVFAWKTAQLDVQKQQAKGLTAAAEERLSRLETEMKEMRELLHDTIIADDDSRWQRLGDSASTSHSVDAH